MGQTSARQMSANSSPLSVPRVHDGVALAAPASHCRVFGAVRLEVSRRFVDAITVFVSVSESVARWVQRVDRIVERVAVAVGADAGLHDFEPVGLDEEGQFGVVVAGVEVLQARVGVVAFADEAFGLFWCGWVEFLREEGPAEGAVGAAVSSAALRIGDVAGGA